MNSIKKYLKYIFSVEKVVLGLGVGSLIVILILELWLFHVQELFSGASVLGKIVENVCFSIIAAVVFYTLVTHVPLSITRERFTPIINGRAGRIIRCCTSIHADFSNNFQNLDLNSSGFLSEANLRIVFENMNPNSPSPLSIGGQNISRATWFGYFLIKKEDSRGFMRDLMILPQYIEPELLEILVSIEYCLHFSHLEMLGSTANRSQNMGSWSDEFIRYSNMCQKLQQYLTATPNS
jgi:hypothetical protein